MPCLGCDYEGMPHNCLPEDHPECDNCGALLNIDGDTATCTGVPGCGLRSYWDDGHWREVLPKRSV